MLILFAAVIVPGSFMMGDHSETLESAFDFHTNDATQLSEASVYGSYMAESYIPRSFNLSVDKGIYSVGRQGANISWSSENIPENLDELLERELETQITWNVQNYTEDAEAKMSCDVNSSYEVDLMPENNAKQIVSNNPSIVCTGVNSEAVYGLPNSIEMDFDPETIFSLSQNTYSFLTQLRSDWSQNVEGSYSDSTVTCGEQDYSTPEQSVVSDAEDDITSTFNDVLSQHPDNSNFDAEASIVGPNYRFRYGSESEVFSANEESSSEDLGDCNCETCGSGENTYPCNCETRYRTTVTIEPDETNVDWLIENNNRKILTKDGVKNPLFNVNSYTQKYD